MTCSVEIFSRGFAAPLKGVRRTELLTVVHSSPSSDVSILYSIGMRSPNLPSRSRPHTTPLNLYECGNSICTVPFPGLVTDPAPGVAVFSVVDVIVSGGWNSPAGVEEAVAFVPTSEAARLQRRIGSADFHLVGDRAGFRHSWL